MEPNNVKVPVSRGLRGDVLNMRDASMAFWQIVARGRSFLIFAAGAVIYMALLLLWRHPSLDRGLIGWFVIVVTLAFEAVNTSIEAICDYAWPREDGERASVARIKHLAAAIVTTIGIVGTIPICLFILISPR